MYIANYGDGIKWLLYIKYFLDVGKTAHRPCQIIKPVELTSEIQESGMNIFLNNLSSPLIGVS